MVINAATTRRSLAAVCVQLRTTGTHPCPHPPPPHPQGGIWELLRLTPLGEGRSSELEVNRLEIRSTLCHVLTMWPWWVNLASLSFSYIMEIGITIHPSEARKDQIGSPHCTTQGGAVHISLCEGWWPGIKWEHFCCLVWSFQSVNGSYCYTQIRGKQGSLQASRLHRVWPGFVLQGRAGLWEVQPVKPANARRKGLPGQVWEKQTIQGGGLYLKPWVRNSLGTEKPLEAGHGAGMDETKGRSLHYWAAKDTREHLVPASCLTRPLRASVEKSWVSKVP